MPQQLSLRLETYGTTRDGYKTGIGTALVLQQCGWTITKKTREYRFLQPPEGQKAGKTIDVNVIAPTDDEIMAVAEKLHRSAEPGSRVLESLSGWPVLYTPAHVQRETIQEIDPFTGDKVGQSKSRDQPAHAVCRIGHAMIWEAEVRWDQNGTPILSKFPSREVSAFHPGLFDSIAALGAMIGHSSMRLPEEVEPGTYPEGAIERIVVNAYERSASARAACIAHYGTRCRACEVDLGEVYGDIGEGFIHVHHLKPLAEIGQDYDVDPIQDLRPVCPNCHAMLHRTDPPMSIDGLHSRIRQ